MKKFKDFRDFAKEVLESDFLGAIQNGFALTTDAIWGCYDVIIFNKIEEDNLHLCLFDKGKSSDSHMLKKMIEVLKAHGYHLYVICGDRLYVKDIFEEEDGIYEITLTSERDIC